MTEMMRLLGHYQPEQTRHPLDNLKDRQTILNEKIALFTERTRLIITQGMEAAYPRIEEIDRRLDVLADMQKRITAGRMFRA